MTVDKILAGGRYRDRQGREWICAIRWFSGDSTWYAADDVFKREPEMRLLIERDMHDCDGLGLTSCVDHPTVIVLQDRDTGFWLVFERYGIECVGREYREWSEAMDDARALAVSRE